MFGIFILIYPNNSKPSSKHILEKKGVAHYSSAEEKGGHNKSYYVNKMYI